MGFNSTKNNTPVSTAVTHEGGKGFKRDPRNEIYSLVVTSFLSGDSFYEKQDERLQRMRSLISEVLSMKNGREFLAGLAVYARNQMNMRSAPTMLSTELFVSKVEDAEKVAEQIWVRGDEHLEALAYLKGTETKRPKRLLKAIAKRLLTFNAYRAVKYACSNKSFTQRDALRLAHPTPKNAAQSALFKYMSQGWDKLSDTEKLLLPEIAKMKQGNAITWEQQISTKGSTKDNWEAIIPQMGYMALLRNLRNFMEKGVSSSTINKVAEKLSDPEEVKRSRQLPFRFYNAYLALNEVKEGVGKHKLGSAIRKALDLSVDNIPELKGETLVLVDLSGSMSSPLSISKGKPSTMSLATAGCVLGAIVSANINGEVWGFGSRAKKAVFGAGDDVMSRIEKIRAAFVDCGTEIGASFIQATDNFKKKFSRCIVITDMQSADDTWKAVSEYRKRHGDFSMYTIDLSAYKVSCLPKGNGCYQLAGFSDKLFHWIAEEEATTGAIVQKLVELGTSVLSDKVKAEEVEEEDETE